MNKKIYISRVILILASVSLIAAIYIFVSPPRSFEYILDPHCGVFCDGMKYTANSIPNYTPAYVMSLVSAVLYIGSRCIYSKKRDSNKIMPRKK